MEDEVITLTELNKELLRRALMGGMNGSYYEYGDVPDGGDIDGFLEKKNDVITWARLDEIARFYTYRAEYFMKMISDEEECTEWLKCRAFPFDDPW